MGVSKGDLGPVPKGQGLPIPSTAFFPSQRLSFDDDLGTAGRSNLLGQEMDKQEDEGFYSPEGFSSLHVTT
jgi:hypothetical protein